MPSVLLYRARDQVEASLLVAMIEASGVRAWTVGGQASLAFGELGADAILVDVRVEQSNHARALELVDEYFASAKREREADPSTPWTCEACGELVESAFSSCWKCEAARP
jgi:hypothetical protein